MKQKRLPFGFACFIWPPTRSDAHAATLDFPAAGQTGETDCKDESETREVAEFQRARQGIQTPRCLKQKNRGNVSDLQRPTHIH